MDKLFDLAWPIFQSHDKSNEFEFRLGRSIGRKFDTNVGEQRFLNILAGLNAYSGWEMTNVREEDVYTNDKHRLTVNRATEAETFMEKQRLQVEDFRDASFPLDVRFAVSSEDLLDVEEYPEFTRQVQRTRHSFFRKNLVICMTVVKGEPEDPDSEDAVSYQVELEIVDPKLVKDDNDFYKLVHKVYDVMKLI